MTSLLRESHKISSYIAEFNCRVAIHQSHIIRYNQSRSTVKPTRKIDQFESYLKDERYSFSRSESEDESERNAIPRPICLGSRHSGPREL